MSNTIEKALLRQQQEAAKQQDKTTSLEKAVEANNAQAQQTEVEQTPIVETSQEPILEPAQAPENDYHASSSVIKGRHFEIDLEDLENKGFVTLNTMRSQINEEYREIKRKLLANAFGALSRTLNNANIIMVTSARPSEGKTFTAVNLAMSIAAEQDKRVLLVDADVLKPNVLRTLGLRERSGLMEFLIGEVKEIGDVMYSTNMDKLRIIPAGRSHHLSTELLASGMMNETINEFSNRYPDRVIIIDTPPIIGINESAILANFAGQAVVVVEEGRSKLADIQKSVERLNPEMAIGFVVNKSLGSSENTGYYGYHYYGSDRKKES